MQKLITSTLVRGSCEHRTPFLPTGHRQGVSGQFVHGMLLLMLLLVAGCSNSGDSLTDESEPVLGCDGQTYVMPSASPYVLPYAVGRTFETGLTNCSSSFHAAGRPDNYAFDFNMPMGTPFVAARAGTVVRVVESAPSSGGGAGNSVVIDHGDNTYGIYLHSPQNGIYVAVNDVVNQGDVLGETGLSGLAGYPHLHFIVVRDDWIYPYSGLAISFRNAEPRHIVLQGNTEYKAGTY